MGAIFARYVSKFREKRTFVEEEQNGNVLKPQRCGAWWFPDWIQKVQRNACNSDRSLFRTSICLQKPAAIQPKMVFLESATIR